VWVWAHAAPSRTTWNTHELEVERRAGTKRIFVPTRVGARARLSRVTHDVCGLRTARGAYGANSDGDELRCLRGNQGDRQVEDKGRNEKARARAQGESREIEREYERVRSARALKTLRWMGNAGYGTNVIW
jgi:hypothetical protein